MNTLLSILMIPVSVVCGKGGGMVLEKRDVQFFKVNETIESGLVHLEISGLAFHSSMAVEKITMSTEGKSISILVYLVAAKKGLSGNFKYNLSVPSNIDLVSFGSTRTVIWNRH
jgi:hypothetical protein